MPRDLSCFAASMRLDGSGTVAWLTADRLTISPGPADGFALADIVECRLFNEAAGSAGSGAINLVLGVTDRAGRFARVQMRIRPYQPEPAWEPFVRAVLAAIRTANPGARFVTGGMPDRDQANIGIALTAVILPVLVLPLMMLIQGATIRGWAYLAMGLGVWIALGWWGVRLVARHTGRATPIDPAAPPGHLLRHAVQSGKGSPQ
jgi:hypothetical protein